MAKKKEVELNEIETRLENIDIIEEEAAENEGKTWQEEVEVAGKDLADFVKKMYHEVTVRRIIVKNKDGRVLLDIPAAVGALGFLPPLFVWSAIAVGAAVLTNCSVTLERVEPKPATKEEAADAEEKVVIA